MLGAWRVVTLSRDDGVCAVFFAVPICVAHLADWGGRFVRGKFLAKQGACLWVLDTGPAEAFTARNGAWLCMHMCSVFACAKILWCVYSRVMALVYRCCRGR